MLKRYLSLLLLLLCLASCEKSTPHPNTLRLNLSDDPTSLDPRSVRALKDLTVVKQLFEGLMRLDRSGIPQPAIAQHVEISQDLLTYTFHLREAYWNNSDPVTSKDFIHAWSKVLDPDFATDYSYMLYSIKNAQLAREGKCSLDAIGVKAPDEYTLIVELESPTPYFLELVTFPTYFPVNHKVDQSQRNWTLPPGDQFVCNGPFCLEKWSPQSELVLKKNLNYWDSSSVKLEQLKFSIISDINTESHLFEKNQLDWLGQPISQNISSEMIEKLKREEKLNFCNIAGTFWFQFNTEKAPFDDKRIRKAFSYAINRQEIIAHILHGYQSVATGPVPPSMRIRELPYFQDADVQQAKKLLGEVLIENEWTLATFPKVTLTYISTERNAKIAQLVQQQWKNAFGITVSLQAEEIHVYRTNTKQGLYQVASGDWIADFNDPLAFLDLFKYKKGMNDTFWQNDDFISLLNSALLENDSIIRKEFLQKAEEVLVGEMPIAPVYHYTFDYIKKPHVQNEMLSPHGIADFKEAQIIR